MTNRAPFTVVQCVHYRGAAAPCKKGIERAQVVDDDGRAPCITIRGITGKVACDLRVMPTEPAPGEPGAATQMLNAILEGRCPKCSEPINGEMEFNGSILAMPCRHVIRSARD